MKYRLLTAGVLLLIGGAATAQSMYRCGSTFSQTPCGEGQREVQVKVPGDCDLESNRYLAKCARSSLQPREPAALEEFRRQKADLVARRRLPPPDPAAVDQTKRLCESSVRHALKDPEAARIREVRRMGPSILLLGSDKTLPAVDYVMMVNGKNSYGGYVGERPWVCVLDVPERNVLEVKEVGAGYLKQPWYDQ